MRGWCGWAMCVNLLWLHCRPPLTAPVTPHYSLPTRPRPCRCLPASSSNYADCLFSSSSSSSSSSSVVIWKCLANDYILAQGTFSLNKVKAVGADVYGATTNDNDSTMMIANLGELRTRPTLRCGHPRNAFSLSLSLQSPPSSNAINYASRWNWMK